MKPHRKISAPMDPRDCLLPRARSKEERSRHVAPKRSTHLPKLRRIPNRDAYCVTPVAGEIVAALDQSCRRVAERFPNASPASPAPSLG